MIKRILLAATFATMIGCTLDTFKSDNLASWSINLDFPLFKADYTVAELLSDYDELEVEQFENSTDSIYVFNASTPHEVIVQDYTITRTGNSIDPVYVPVAAYEIDIPTLPSELDGINFVDIDLTIDVDLSQFNVSLADSVIVDWIEFVATNDVNEIAQARITDQDILTGDPLVVQDPENLINIRPASVIALGFITIYPSNQPGTQVFGQTITLTSQLHAPLILEITETSTFNTDPELVDASLEDEDFESFTIFAEIDNQMGIGGQLQVLVAQDTTNFHANSFGIPDTLLSMELLANQTQTETIELARDKIDLITDSTYMKVVIDFIGNTDAQGNTLPTYFFTDDSIKVLFYSSTEVLIDPGDNNSGEQN